MYVLENFSVVTWCPVTPLLWGEFVRSSSVARFHIHWLPIAIMHYLYLQLTNPTQRFRIVRFKKHYPGAVRWLHMKHN